MNHELSTAIQTAPCVVEETLVNRERFGEAPLVNRQELDQALHFAISKTRSNLAVFGKGFPRPFSEKQRYPVIDNTEWTSSFWTGVIWLAYEASRDGVFLAAAEEQMASYSQRAERRIATDHHDLGFLYSLSAIAGYRITGKEDCARIAMMAADLLMERYLPSAGIIQAWGDLRNPSERGRMIIDCNMNLPLLYWASNYSKDTRYGQAADNHARKARLHLVRPDASTFHTFFMNADTGAPLRGATFQGFSDKSCWARGQAWGIYGFALSYRYTRKAEFLETACKLANYFLNRLPTDLVSYWDLIFTSGTEFRDSSATAIAACGLLELVDLLPEAVPERSLYRGAANEMIRSLSQLYSSATQPEATGILLHAVYDMPHHRGIDECVVWGDYFYFEALARLKGSWTGYW